MKIIKATELFLKETISATSWAYSIKLKDIFELYQNKKITEQDGIKKIINRLLSFLDLNKNITDSLKNSINDIINTLKDSLKYDEYDIDEIDKIVDSIYDIADEFNILIK